MNAHDWQVFWYGVMGGFTVGLIGFLYVPIFNRLTGWGIRRINEARGSGSERRERGSR
jgi:hypothetical protein